MATPEPAPALSAERIASLLRQCEIRIAGGWEHSPAMTDVTTGELRALLAREEAWSEYVLLLVEEISPLAGLAYAHGWRGSPERNEKGRALRARLGLGDDNRPIAPGEGESHAP